MDGSIHVLLGILNNASIQCCSYLPPGCGKKNVDGPVGHLASGAKA